MKRNQPERKEQIAFFKELNRLPPIFQLAYAIPNGGSRHFLEAVNFKKSGVKAGVPDICFPVARMHYHGLYIEMKEPSRKNKVEGGGDQEWWINNLKEQGYKVVVCYTCAEAMTHITSYEKGIDKECIIEVTKPRKSKKIDFPF